MADITDKITDVRNAARPNSARVTVARTTAATDLECNDLTGWPTASKVHFVTYQIDTNNDPIGGTQLDCSGIVSGSTITSVTVIDGTDNGNAVGEVVEMLPTAAWGQDLSDALMVAHDRTGAPKSGVTYPASTFTTPTIASFVNATHSHTNAAGGGTLGAAAVPALDYSAQTLSSPSMFSASSASSAYTADDPIFFGTELFDTNNNYNTADGRYTAPVTGFYFVNAGISISINGQANTGFGAYIKKNGSDTILYGQQYVNMYSGAYATRSNVSGIVQLTAGDYITAHSTGSGGAGANQISGGYDELTYFKAFLVSRT